MPENDNDILVKMVSRVDEKLSDVILRLSRLEVGHEQIAALSAQQAKQLDELTDHEIRLTKIETKGGIITTVIAVFVSLCVGLVTASYKAIIGG